MSEQMHPADALSHRKNSLVLPGVCRALHGSGAALTTVAPIPPGHCKGTPLPLEALVLLDVASLQTEKA